MALDMGFTLLSDAFAVEHESREGVRSLIMRIEAIIDDAAIRSGRRSLFAATRLLEGREDRPNSLADGLFMDAMECYAESSG